MTRKRFLKLARAWTTELHFNGADYTKFNKYWASKPTIKVSYAEAWDMLNKNPFTGECYIKTKSVKNAE